jgi:hypothetical protein
MSFILLPNSTDIWARNRRLWVLGMVYTGIVTFGWQRFNGKDNKSHSVVTVNVKGREKRERRRHTQNSNMKHRVLLLNWILCCHIRNISPAAIVPPEAPEREQTSAETDHARYLQSASEEKPPGRLAPPVPAPALTNAPSEEPTMTIPKPTPDHLPWVGPSPCPPSSSCPSDSNLMHKSCVLDCVPDARVGRKKLAGWVCGRC